MASRRALTGGTGDVNPQWMSIYAKQTGQDETTTLAFAIPIQRLPGGRGAQVMEVLWVDYDAPANQGTSTAITTHR